MKLFKCDRCGNLIYTLNDKCEGIACCGLPVKKLEANTTDAAFEKHVPKVYIEGNTVSVKVGSEEHPMTEEHYIEYIIIETNKGIQINHLKPGDKPETVFLIEDDEGVLQTYAYCNLHGLWSE